MGKIMIEDKTKYLALYPDGHHEEIICGELIHRGGAEGKIYKSATHKNTVIKIFHEKEKTRKNKCSFWFWSECRDSLQNISR